MVSVKIMKDVQEGFEIERELVNLFESMREARGVGHGEFSRKVFGDSRSSETKWTRTVKGSQTGKPQTLSVRDAYAIAKYFGLQLHTLLAGITRHGASQSGQRNGSVQ